MKADGFTLDDKRTPIEQNDIPDIIARFANLEAENSRTKKDQSFFVPKQEIVENNYDLTITKYKEVEHEKVVYDKPEVIIERIVLSCAFNITSSHLKLLDTLSYVNLIDNVF